LCTDSGAHLPLQQSILCSLLDNNRLTGPLPPSWAGTGALFRLRFL